VNSFGARCKLAMSSSAKPAGAGFWAEVEMEAFANRTSFSWEDNEGERATARKVTAGIAKKFLVMANLLCPGRASPGLSSSCPQRYQKTSVKGLFSFPESWPGQQSGRQVDRRLARRSYPP